ncbi:MAG: hypothetical protein PHF00_13365, partial [Elusimicrobia bacterium]|nr:hypothetical protein [Elusimicrobiota bacterium]
APSLRYVSQETRYPRVVDVSPAWLWRASDSWSSLLALRLRKVAAETLEVSGGAELRYGKLAALRLGASDQGLSTGVGLRLGNTRLDYAARLHDLGIAHLVTFSQSFGHTREELEATIRRGISELTRSEGARLARAYLQKAEAELADDRVSEALRNFEAAALLDPGNAAIKDRIAEVSSRWDESLKRQMVLRTATRAREQFAAGNLLASRQYWKSVLELDPADAEAQTALARVDRALSRDERSRLDELRRAQSASEIQGTIAMARSFRERGQLRQARLEAEKASARYPEDGVILAFLGKVKDELAEFLARKSAEADRLEAAGDLAGAMRAVEAALREDPGNFKLSEKAVHLRGLLAKRLTPDERKAVEQRYYRAVEQYLKGNYAVAAKFADEVLRADPSSEAGRVLKEKIEAAAGLTR